MKSTIVPKVLSCLFLVGILFSCSTEDSDTGPRNPNNQTPPPDSGNPSPDPGSNPDPMDDPTGSAPCEDGMAGPYPCEGYDLLGHLDLNALSAGSANDIWGWADPDTGVEYALVGLDNGTAFVSLEDPESPELIGTLRSATNSSPWRDIKVYDNHAYIVAEASGHGMQVFDLTQLRNPGTTPRNFSATTTYREFGNAHNIVINEASGFAYAVGTGPDAPFNGGAHFINLQNPSSPQAAGGYGISGYTHDAQVVTYNGPDPDYSGREIFIGSNEDRVVIVDVTDKGAPSFIASITYPNIGYTHQGWFTEDQRYFLLGDEIDELNVGFRSRTLIFNFTDLDDPSLAFSYSGPTTAIDHNGYVLGNQFFLANYTAGLRVIDISSIGSGFIQETGYFDTYTQSNATEFNGVWSVYPYLPSGRVLINDINNGFFVVEPSNP